MMIREKYEAVQFFKFLKPACEKHRCRKCKAFGSGVLFSGHYAYGVSKRVVGRRFVSDNFPTNRLLFWNYCQDGEITEIDETSLHKEVQPFSKHPEKAFDTRGQSMITMNTFSLQQTIQKLNKTDIQLSKAKLKFTVGEKIEVDIISHKESERTIHKRFSPIQTIERAGDAIFTFNAFDFLTVTQNAFSNGPINFFYGFKNAIGLSQYSNKEDEVIFLLQNLSHDKR